MNSEQLLTVECPMTRTMAVIGTKWKPIIIHAIGEKHIRFGHIAEKMPLVSRKVLTSELKELEKDGILIREAFAEMPPRVEYHLTPKGLALLPILQQMCEWTKIHGSQCCGGQ